jgi:hypothetical protein
MMEPGVDRRRSQGRRRGDGAAQGLLHDLGHQMTTLSYLVEAVRGDVVLPDDSGFRMELLSLEMTRMLDIIASEVPDAHEAEDVGAINLAAVIGQVTELAGFAHEASDQRGEGGLQPLQRPRALPVLCPGDHAGRRLGCDHRRRTPGHARTISLARQASEPGDHCGARR